MPDTTYPDHIGGLITWLEATAQFMYNEPAARAWCTLDLPGLSVTEIQDYFARTDVNSQFEKEYKLRKLTNNPVAFLQQDSDGLFSLQKGYLIRHQPRLSNYRDDCEQKDVRIYNALNLAKAKLQHMKDIA